jgi:hypothetical protein
MSSVVRSREQQESWDRFLDAYSVYLRDPNAIHAALLHLSCTELERADPSFSAESFGRRFGWSMALS